MVDPASGWFEIIELPLTSVKYTRKGEEIIEIVIDNSSEETSQLFNKQWLSRYPRLKYVIYNNGSEFKLHFQELCALYSLEQKPTSVRNPQANAILERLHAVIGDMLCTSNLDNATTLNDKMIE